MDRYLNLLGSLCWARTQSTVKIQRLARILPQQNSRLLSLSITMDQTYRAKALLDETKLGNDFRASISYFLREVYQGSGPQWHRNRWGLCNLGLHDFWLLVVCVNTQDPSVKTLFFAEPQKCVSVVYFFGPVHNWSPHWKLCSTATRQ